jgi:hypothetical protein
MNKRLKNIILGIAGILIIVVAVIGGSLIQGLIQGFINHFSDGAFGKILIIWIREPIDLILLPLEKYILLPFRRGILIALILLGTALLVILFQKRRTRKLKGDKYE